MISNPNLANHTHTRINETTNLQRENIKDISLSDPSSRFNKNTLNYKFAIKNTMISSKTEGIQIPPKQHQDRLYRQIQSCRHKQ